MSYFGKSRNRGFLFEEETKGSLAEKLFGKSGSRTDLYTSIQTKWEESGAEGTFEIVLTPSSDKTSINVEVNAEGGSDARAASEAQGMVEEEIRGLKPADWSDLKAGLKLSIPGAVSYKSSEEITLNESLRKFIRESISEFSAEDPGMMMPSSGFSGRVFHNNGAQQESNMIKSNLFVMAKKANEMHDEIADGDDLPEWVQEKIAVAGAMIDSVYDYLDYEYHKFNAPQMPPQMDYSGAPLMEKKKSGSVVKGKYHGETYKSSSAMAKAIEKGASYEDLKKMAKWANNPDAVVNAALMAVKGKPARKNEG